MIKWEARMKHSLCKNILWWGAVAVLLIGVFIRYSFVPLLVADMEFLNLNWYHAIKTNGMGGVLAPELQYNYSPLHLYLWGLVAALLPDAPNMETLKGISLLAESLLVVFACLLVWLLLPSRRKALGTFICFSLLWLHPLLILNAAGWGQTDALMAAPSLLSVYLLLKRRHALSLAMLGVALAFKLQAIFLLPVFLFAYFCQKNTFSMLWFLLVPSIWVFTGIPMLLLGESPLYAVQCYLGQADLYSHPTYNYPNLYALLGDALSNKQMIQGMVSRYGMALAITALGGMMVWMVAKKASFTSQGMLLLGSWCILVCTFFLPRMHERYGLVGEILLLCWAICLGKPRGFAYILLGLLPVLSAYCEYIFRYPIVSLQAGGVLNMVLLGLLTWELLRSVQPSFFKTVDDPTATLV